MIEKTYEADTFKEMTEDEIIELVKECFEEKTSKRTQDTIVHLRKCVNIVDVFTIKRHRIYEVDKKNEVKKMERTD
jgi:hypothetical protein